MSRARDSTWTSHRIYLRLTPEPTWFNVEWALDTLGFSDTESGRREFDDFVMDVDLTDWRPHLDDSERVTTSDTAIVDLRALMLCACEVAGVAIEAWTSRRRAATHARRLVSIVGTIDLGLTYRAVGDQTDLTPGAVFNLVARSQSRDLTSDLERVRTLLLERETSPLLE